MKTVKLMVLDMELGAYVNKEYLASDVVEAGVSNVSSILGNQELSLRGANKLFNKAMMALHGKENLKTIQVNLGACGYAFRYELKAN